MIGIILGGSGKIGKKLLNYISTSKKLNFSNLIIQSNSKEPEIPTELEKIATSVKCDFSKVEEVENLLKTIPQKIDVLFNLISLFEETPLNAKRSQIEQILKVNFLNQAIFLKELLTSIEVDRIIQFLDYCILSPYTKRYFWYSISRMGMFDFYKGLSKYFYENKKEVKMLILLPRLIETENEFKQIAKTIEEFLESNNRFVVKVI